MVRILGATSNIFFSLVLGAAALAVVAVNWPGSMETLLDWGSWVTDELGSTGLDSKYNVWVKFLMNEQQIVFMGFVIVMRVILALLMAGLGSMFGLNRRY
jgi:hypothetical protein